MKSKNYPPHLYNKNRRQVATDYIQHELRKLFPSLNSKSFETMDGDVKNWFDNSIYLYPIRDFWNGFWGIAIGFKLKIGLLNFITAQNIDWKKEKLDIKKLYFGGKWPPQNPQGQEKYTSVIEIKNFYKIPSQKIKFLKISNKNFKNRIKDNSPIIVTEKKHNQQPKLVIYDGNGRVNRRILQNQKTILAWIGKFKNKPYHPQNYWIPTPLLMELTSLAKQNWENKKEDSFKNTINTIKQIINDSNSTSGLYELKNRALPSNKQFQKDFWHCFNH